MRNKFVRSGGWYALCLASCLPSCDTFQEDFIPEEKQIVINQNATDYYILANTPAIIDVKTIVTTLVSVAMKVSADPTRGSLVYLSDYIFKYTPSPSFTAGEDQFAIEFRGERVVQMTTITVHMTESISGFPCSLYAVEDHYHGRPGQAIDIDFLDNDRVCGIRESEVTASISFPPRHGQAVINNSSILYTPESDFQGIDEIVYSIRVENGQQTVAADSIVSHGLIRINVTSDDCPSQIFESVALDLTDEVDDILNTGECAGGYDIRVWEIAIPPCVQYGYYSQQISQSNASGSFCSGRDGGFSYYPDPEMPAKNDTARFEVCVNGYCRQVIIYVVREESG